MRIVIDANRAIAALIKDSTTRQILFDWNFEFVAPDHILIEIRKHEGSITKSTVISKDEFEILLALIFEHITIIPETEYKEFLELIKDEIKDTKDLQYYAACLASNAHGIWTHDPDFLEQHKIKIFTNIDMLKLSGQAKSD